jgi:capsular exopolysaccharide synthesis family protein
MSAQPDTANVRPKTRELRDYVHVMRRYWLGAMLVLLITIGLVAIATALQPRVYESTATGLTQAATGDDLSMAFAGESLAKSRAESYVRVATSDAVAKKASAILETDRSIGSLLANVRATLPTGTAVIQITASGSTPEEAAELANAWTEALAQQVKELETPDGAIGDPALSFVPLATARAPYLPSSPNINAALALAVVAGLVLAFVYTILRHHFDRRVRTAAQIEAILGAPVIGTVPASDELRDRKRIVEHGDGGDAHELFAIAESLRELRTNLSYIDVDSPPRVVVMTSSVPGEGKSTLTANLADAIASSGTNVVVIDCDLRRPTQARLFGLRGGVGLTEVLGGRVALNDALQAPSSNPYLRVLGSGRVPPNPSELLGSRTMSELVRALSDVSLVILDAPPLLSVTDASVMSRIADGVVITVGAKQVTSDQLAKANQAIDRVKGRVLGAVLNKVPPNGIDAVDYGYYRGEYYYTGPEVVPDADAPAASTDTPAPAPARSDDSA